MPIPTPEEMRKNRPAVFNGIDPFNPKTVEQQRMENVMGRIDPFNPKTAEQQQAEKIKNIAEAQNTAPVAPSLNLDTVTPAQTQENWRQTLLDQYADAEKNYNDLLQQNEQAQRAEASRKRIGALADAISGVANLWGTSRGAFNQEAPRTYKMISDNIIRDRQIRQNNINTASRRLDDLSKALQMAGYRQSNLDFKKEDLAFKQWREGNLNANRAAKIIQGNNRIQASIDNNERNNTTRQYVADVNLQGKLASVNATNFKTTTQANTEAAKIAAKAGEAAIKEIEDNNKRIISELADSDNIAITRDEIGEAMYGPKQNWTAQQIVAVGDIKKKDIEQYANTHPDWAAKKGIKPVPKKGSGAAATSSTTSPSKPGPGDYKGGGAQSKKDKINSFRGAK